MIVSKKKNENKYGNCLNKKIVMREKLKREANINENRAEEKDKKNETKKLSKLIDN